MNEKFSLRAKDVTDTIEVNHYTAYFPQFNSAKDEKKRSYVKIKNDNKSRIFEAKSRPAAVGDDIILSDKNLKSFGAQLTDITVKDVSCFIYWVYSLFHYNLWTFIGFLVALSGVLIDGSLKLGEAGIGIECSRALIIFLKIFSFCLGIIGTFILLIKALAKK